MFSAHKPPRQSHYLPNTLGNSARIHLFSLLFFSSIAIQCIPKAHSQSVLNIENVLSVSKIINQLNTMQARFIYVLFLKR